jgi:hypothetical protein
MGLLITSYLILTNMSATALTFHVASFTAMDAWLYICKLVVIAALFEYAWLLRMRMKIITATQSQKSLPKSKQERNSHNFK